MLFFGLLSLFLEKIFYFFESFKSLGLEDLILFKEIDYSFFSKANSWIFKAEFSDFSSSNALTPIRCLLDR